MNKLLKISSVILTFIVLCAAVSGQATPKALIGDGTHLITGTAIYSSEATSVFDRVRNADLRFPKFEGRLCTLSDTFRIVDSAKGNFTGPDVDARAYLYSDCDQRSNQQIEGIIILVGGRTQAHVAYPYSDSVKIEKISDLDGNAVDELAVSTSKKSGNSYQTAVRVLEFSNGNLKKIGSFQLQKAGEFLIASRIFAEKGVEPKFFESKFQTDGYKWKNIQFEKPISPDDDSTAYSIDRSQQGILKHLAFFTFVLQLAAFAALLIFVVYEFAASGKKGAAEIEPSKNKEDQTSASIDSLPKLDPINCPNCGAGVPLREGEMTCPNCAAKMSATENYFDLARERETVAAKLRTAASYIRRANLFSSNWIRCATAILAIWVGYSMVLILVLINKGNLAPYQGYFTGRWVTGAVGIACFSTLFWVISLLFGFALWSPRVRRSLPVVEFNAKAGHAETAKCSQCGGAINYRANDIAAVCGYCGVETYRAKLAWKLRNLTNEAGKKAAFSLIDAQKAVESAVWEITGTPRVFAFLLILIAVFGGVAWLISAAYDQLPEGLKDFIGFIGEILDLL